MGEIAKLLGEPLGGQVAQQVALRGAKAAALATRPSPSQDRGYAYVDFDLPQHSPSGVRAVALVPGAYAEEPELFYGPFMQLGAYMKGKGMIESEGLAFAMDLALDPLNLVSFGTAGAAGKLGIKWVSGLTQAGKLSRLIGAVSEGGRIRNGSAVVDKVIVALEAAGKVAGHGDEIRAAAAAGNDAAIKSIVETALKSDEIVPELKSTLEAFQRDRKALGQFLEHLDDFRAMHELPSEAFLQPTVAGRISAGQVEPLVSIVSPSNPFHHPLRFTRQMLGFHYGSERFAVPMSRTAVKGLEKVGAGSLFEVAGRAPLFDPTDAIKDLEEGMPVLERRVSALREQLAQAFDPGEKKRIEGQIEFVEGSLASERKRLADYRSRTPLDMVAAEAKEADAFQAAKFTAGDLDAGNAVMAMHMARILPGTPTDRVLFDIGAGVDEATLEKAYKALPGNKNAALDTPAFEKFKEDAVAGMNDARRAVDQVRTAERDAAMDALTDEFRRSVSVDPTLQAEEVGALSAVQADVMASQMRRSLDLFSIKSIQADAYSPGNGLAARAEFQSLMARATTDNVRAVIKGSYKGGLAREFVAELPQSIIEHPQLWDVRDGKYFLTATMDEMRAAKADFLIDSLQRSKASPKSAHLETHLRTEGLAPGVSRITAEMKASYEMIGKNLVQNEGVLRQVRNDYFSHIFRPNAKYYKEAHLRPGHTQVRETFAAEEAGRQLDELMGEEFKVLADKANQGKVTFEEIRKFSEAEALRFERLGFGEYVKDGVAVFSGYLDASGKSVLINRLWRDLPEIAETLTPAALGKRGVGVSEDVIRKAKRVMAVEPPRSLMPYYKRMFVRPRVLGPTDDPKALTKLVTAEKALATADENARKRVAAKLQGKKVVAGFRLRDKVTNEAVPFQAEWVLTDSIPDNLVGAKEIKGKVAQIIDADGVLARLRGEVTKAREEIQGAAVKAAGTEAPEATHGALWVFEDDYNHLAEAFAIREKPSSEFLRKYDRWNAAFKSVVLIGDIFHFNVLAISQALLNPGTIMKHLYDDAGRLLPGVVEGGFGLSNAAVKAGAGAAVGAGIGVAQGEDARGVLTWSLVGGLYGGVIGSAMNNARSGLRAAMNPAHIDTLHWMGVGGWRGRPDDRSIGLLNRALKSMRDKLARTEGASMTLHAIDGTRHLADAWDELLWSTLHNGSKHHYFQVRWAKELPKLEGRAGFQALTNAEQYALKAGLAREIVQTSNNVFGGQTFRFLFDNPEFQHIARRFLLSPDWTFSRLALASGFFMNMDPAKQALIGAGIGTGVQLVEAGADPDATFSWRGPILGAGLGLALGKWSQGIQRRMLTKGDFMAKEARRVASAALLGGYVFANAVNYGLTGRWLHENPEGKRTSIDIGDGNWVALGKPWVEAFEFAGIYEKEKYPVPVVSRLVSKGATVPVLALRILANKNDFGGPLFLPDDSPFEMASKAFDVTVPLPILGQGPARLALQAARGEARPGAVPAAAIRTLGFPVRGPGRGGMPLDVGALQRAIQSSAGAVSPPAPALVGGQSLLESGL